MKSLTALFILMCLVLVVSSCLKPALPPSSAPASPSTPNTSPSPPVSSPPLPSSLTPLLTPIPEDQSAEQILRRYVWEYDRREWTLELTIPETLYNYYKEIPRPPTRDYSVYVTHPLDDIYVHSLTVELGRIAQEEGFDSLGTAEFVAAFVQYLPYTADSVTSDYDEYPRYPIETLIDNGGDCEDTSILAASLLDSLGYQVTLIIFPDKHCAVGVSFDEAVEGAYFEHNGEEYFYLETTNTDWGIGQIPEELEGVAAHIYEMIPIPILTHSWKATIGGSLVDLEVTVENLGSQLADDVYILAGFDAGESKLWNPKESGTFDLSVGQSINITFSLQVPLEKHTRLVIQIIDDGYAADESYSEWFDT